MAGDYATLVANQNFSATIKVLDSAIQDAAQEHLNALAKLVQLHLNRGYCNQRLQLNRKALKDYEAALVLAPTNVTALHRKGQVLLALNKHEEARAAWQAAVDLADPTCDFAVLLDAQASLKGLSAHGPTAQTPPATAAATAAAAAPAIASTGVPAGTAAGQEPYMNGSTAAAPAADGPAAPASPVAVAAAGPAAATATQPSEPPGKPPATAAGAAPAGAAPAARGAGAAAAASTTGATAATAKADKPGDPSKLGTPGSIRPAAKRAANLAAARAASGAGASTSSSGEDASSSSPRQRPASPASPSTSGPGAASSALAGASKKLSPRAAAASAGASGATANGVEEIDCTARQQGSSGRSGSGSSNVADIRAAAAAAGLSPHMLAGLGGMSPEAVQQMVSNSNAINLAVLKINDGKVVEAEAILDGVLQHAPKELSGRVARGTARALRRNLQGAIDDFTVAIELEPRYPDSWKRRGQARSALDDQAGALADLQKCYDLLPQFEGHAASAASRSEVCVERGLIFQKQRDYRSAVVEFARAVDHDGSNVQAWNLLGLCRTSMGDIRDGVKAYERATQLKPDLKEAWVNMGQALKEEGRTKEAERAFTKALSLDANRGPSIAALRILAQMRQGQGNHAGAVKILDKAIAARKDDGMVEALYLRAACHHALGYTARAMADYDSCIQWTRGNINDEARTFQCLAWYQKELSLYLYHSLDRPCADFCPDTEILALFKELWCKKGPPTQELIATYRPQLPLPRDPQPPPPSVWGLEALQPLVAVADRIGELLQNHHQGFLPNVRQQRAAGFAAAELAQAVTQLLAERTRGCSLWVNSEGSSGQGGCAGRHVFGWRDAMDIVVKWRQLAEPNDQVVWVDLLTRREFEQGFGSHTPMYSGQTKCVRYYMNFDAALALQKQVLLAEGHAFDAANKPIPLGSDAAKAAVKKARTAEDMYLAIGADSWVVVPLQSVAKPGNTLEGTRLTLVKVPNQPNSYEFSIRTPVTPPRWAEFDAELDAAWERTINAMAAGDAAATARSILEYGYYWYNFMPLARGTAAVGYTTILALFWAAGMPINAPIPKDYQVDWEAILSQHPHTFMKRLSSWFLPPAAKAALAAADASSAQGSGSTAASSAAPAVGAAAAAAASNAAASSTAASSIAASSTAPADGSAAAAAADGGASPPAPSAAAAGGESNGVTGGMPPVSSVALVSEVLATPRARLEALNGPDAPRVG